ncbi:collagen-like protein [Streptomyces sp. WAC05374]|uniref:collagen-like protein n=1 Tax=Streptomyces sp. WAC05374 TaxID=2487420 RepID=UPI000F88C417|nr:collagen-like protein [Streptomyces sp. WAC05374]RST11103.1 collagen-like protein [Streptomyces sp. WAC05374]TDF37127.1 collagen-like protein [Streptomyces sp. WAC05374]TDF44882.1 collagen-like protein [Streptomyces sp. WAC05374]TDF45784.1 collagen-like protein [Streptomyces sp. WAC05374]
MTDPVSRTILLLDIEKYSDRDDVEQAYLRRMLYGISDSALESAGIDETLRLRADRGDSVMELIDANASVTALLRALLTEVPVQLRAVNRMASSSAQIRLRAVLATGYVAVDALDGWVGSDLNHACRLLDAELLRAALRERANDFALCVSEGVHAGIVRHGHPGIPAEDFHPITVTSKNGPLRAWLHGPVPGQAGDAGRAAAPGRDGHPGTAPVPGGSGDRPAPGPAYDFRGADVRIDGGFVGGSHHGISGGTFNGDVRIGGDT